MNRTFKHKGLERFFSKSDYRGIPAQYAARIERLLDRLDAAVKPDDMDLPGYRFHPLKGDSSSRGQVSLYSIRAQNGAGALLICVLGSTLSKYSTTAVVWPPRQ